MRRALAGTVTFLAMMSSSRAASPAKLRDEAASLLRHAALPGGDLARDLRAAHGKALEAVRILTGKHRRTKQEEDMLVEVQSLLYWIRKMTPVDLPPPAPAPNEPARPKQGDRGGTPLPHPPARARQRPSRGRRGRWGLPADLAGAAEEMLKRYEGLYESYELVSSTEREFYRRYFQQVALLRRHRDRPLDAAAIAFHAFDEYYIGSFGGGALIVRMLACLEMERLASRPPQDADERTVRALERGFLLLALSAMDFTQAEAHFAAMLAQGMQHPDAKLGLALAKFGAAYIASQAEAAMPTHMRFGRNELNRWFGAPVARVWCGGLTKYSRWRKTQIEEARRQSRRLFTEYADLSPQGLFYRAFSETYWHWYYREKNEMNRSAAAVFDVYGAQERSDAEKVIARVVLNTWMCGNGHVDKERVRWQP
jgi:hypothetical protein